MKIIIVMLLLSGCSTIDHKQHPGWLVGGVVASFVVVTECDNKSNYPFGVESLRKGRLCRVDKSKK